MSRTLVLVLIAAVAIATALLFTLSPPTGPKAPAGKVLRVVQPEGNVVYWVLPGPRVGLSEAVFGTPDNPRALVKPKIDAAPGPVKEVLENVPFLVGLPLEARATNAEGTRYTQTKIPTPFSDDGAIVDGSLSITFVDRQPEDATGMPTATRDKAKLDTSFTDPAGNAYRIELLKVFMPPIPGYKTRGGVMIDDYHHGETGTGTPLMPKVYTYGAFWAIGNVVVNGEVVAKRHVIHFMTTQTVRDQDYHLATDEELPLAAENTIAGQTHHTHGIVLPVKFTEQGPVYQPVKTAFTLPNGQKQPFIHIMFEQDEIVETPPGFSPPKSITQVRRESRAGTREGGTEEAARTVTVEGTEFQFEPSEIEVSPGQKVKVVFKNVGKIAHNFAIPELGVGTDTIQPGQTDTVTFAVGEEKTLRFECSVPGHSEAGMVGELHVKP